MKIKNCEVVGDVDLFSSCKGFLSLNWEGHVEKVFFKVPTDLSWYECIDKGGIPLYGFNEKGDVVCCAVLLRKGEQDIKGNKYNEDVVFVMPANRTDDWGWIEFLGKRAI